MILLKNDRVIDMTVVFFLKIINFLESLTWNKWHLFYLLIANSEGDLSCMFMPNGI